MSVKVAFMSNQTKRPQYRTARLLLGIASLAGIIAIVGGAMALAGAFAGNAGPAALALGAGLILNGLLVVAGAQMGSAALDTAISTRQTADTVAELLTRREAGSPETRAIAGLRAER
ncbi:MAG: hypothetical protein L0G27_07805 [Paracoccus sp. (in: a-proteobacteria)]|nr:hypothetical protein [Paracoccus sp. (in: a-proteobacteria)]